MEKLNPHHPVCWSKSGHIFCYFIKDNIGTRASIRPLKPIVDTVQGNLSPIWGTSAGGRVLMWMTHEGGHRHYGGDLHVTLIDCVINWMYCYCC